MSDIAESIYSSLKDEISGTFSKKVQDVLHILDEEITILQNIKFHLDQTAKWASSVSISDMKVPKITKTIFVHLDIYLLLRSRKITESETLERTKLIDIIQRERSVFVYGHPGSGKTTSMKFCVLNYLDNCKAFPLSIRIPIVLVVREIDYSGGAQDVIFNAVATLLGVKNLDSKIRRFLLDNSSVASNSLSEENLREWLHEDKRRLVRYLDRVCSILVIDGVDESPTNEVKASIYEDIAYLAKGLTKTKLVATTRTGESIQGKDYIRHYEVAPLDIQQVNSFVQKWIVDKAKAAELLRQIRKSPYADAMIKPLTLAHLCAIFERIGKLPDKPKSLYKRIVNLLIQEWDEERSVKRVSKYENFEPDRKFDFLANVAFRLTLDGKRSAFPEELLIRVYKEICEDFDLPPKQAKTVASQIESHTGLIVKAGYDLYEFAHKSIQEYLTAEYINRLPNLSPLLEKIEALPNELAIATTLSSDSSYYFCELIRIFESHVNDPNFFRVFLTRLTTERVDFNRSKSLVIAFLHLYTLYIYRSGGDEGYGQLLLFPSDDNFRYFDSIYSSISKRMDFSIVFQLYDVGVEERHDDEVFVYLELKKEPKIAGGRGGHAEFTRRKEYPEKLLCRKSFLRMKA